MMAACLAACGQGKAESDPLLYRVSDGQGCTVYLLGTIHMGRPDFYPLGTAAEAAYQAAEVLAVEADLLSQSAVDAARLIKDEEEQRLMRESSRKNDETIEATIRQLSRGMTELEVAKIYLKEAAARGASGPSFEPLVCYGPNCADPHHGSDERTRLKDGDSVILDVGLTWQDYCSDMTRTVFCGEPTDEQKRVYELVRAANAAGRAAVHPGVPVSEVDRAARKVIEDAGYGKYFIHRTGHGIGLEEHEFPDVSATGTAVCTPGMCFSVEPGIYLPGKFGVRVEDLVIVTEDGCDTINAVLRELRVI